MSYLLSCLHRKDKDRQLALITIGYLAVCVQEDIASYLPKILEFIRSSLPHKVTLHQAHVIRIIISLTRSIVGLIAGPIG